MKFLNIFSKFYKFFEKIREKLKEIEKEERIILEEEVAEVLKGIFIDMGFRVENVEIQKLLEPYIKPDIIIYVGKNDHRFVIVVNRYRICNVLDLQTYINFTLSAVKILREKGFETIGIVINQYRKFDKLSRKYLEEKKEKLREYGIYVTTWETLRKEKEKIKEILKELLQI